MVIIQNLRPIDIFIQLNLDNKPTAIQRQLLGYMFLYLAYSLRRDGGYSKPVWIEKERVVTWCIQLQNDYPWLRFEKVFLLVTQAYDTSSFVEQKEAYQWLQSHIPSHFEMTFPEDREQLEIAWKNNQLYLTQVLTSAFEEVKRAD